LIKSTHSANWGYEALIDVGIVAIAHFRNPAQKHAAQLLLDPITLKRRILIPVSTYLGAYIVMTRYLRLKKEKVAKALLKTLSLESPAFYENVPKTIAEKSILSATDLGVSSWDAYLLELARELGIGKVYTVDMELAKMAKDIEIVNPIPKKIMDEYHKYTRKFFH